MNCHYCGADQHDIQVAIDLGHVEAPAICCEQPFTNW